MVALSAVLSVLTMLFLKNFPRPASYFLIAISFVIYGLFIAAGYGLKIYALAYIFITLVSVSVVYLCCFWKKIKIGMILMECTARFINEKPTVYVISLITIFFNVLFFAFWTWSFLSLSNLAER